MKNKSSIIHLPNKKNLVVYSVLNIFLVVLVYLYFWGTRIEVINIKPFPNETEIYFVKESDVRAIASDVFTKPLYAFNSNELTGKIIEKSSWVKSVYIEKQFPHTLNIWIEENFPEVCMKTENSEDSQLARYFAYNNSKFLGEVYQKFDCTVIGRSNNFDPENPSDYFDDSNLYDCIINVERVISNSDSIQSRFLIREYVILSQSEISVDSYDQKMNISCLLDYQRSLFYFDKYLENYPDQTDGKEFSLFEDSVVIK